MYILWEFLLVKAIYTLNSFVYHKNLIWEDITSLKYTLFTFGWVSTAKPIFEVKRNKSNLLILTGSNSTPIEGEHGTDAHDVLTYPRLCCLNYS